MGDPRFGYSHRVRQEVNLFNNVPYFFRTIADLENSAQFRATNISGTIQYRNLDRRGQLK